MKVHKEEIQAIFDATEQLEAPLYQRPYVWERERNWEPLLEAVLDLADAQVDERDARPHFLGTIVLEQRRNPIGRVGLRQIIDGQQRLTTLQLALAALRDLCRELGEDKFAQAIDKLTRNNVPLSQVKEDIYKIWPTNADRTDFMDVLTAGSREVVQKHSHADPDDQWLIPDAYLFFAGEFAEWLGPPRAETFAKRLQALYAVLTRGLHLVVIELEGGDDAQEIFETLNALGTPLLPADLVKNHLFHRAQGEGEDLDRLYQRCWQPFDAEKDYWRKEIRHGRLKRPRLDLFLAHYITLMTRQETLVSHLFLGFKKMVAAEKLSSSEQMRRFREYASVYQQFDEYAPTSRVGTFFYRLDELDTTTVYPVLLEVVKRYGNKTELEEIASYIESYLIRRLVCELTTKSYNKVFVAIMSRLWDADDFSPAAMRDALLRETSDIARWPTDEEFRESWTRVRFYRRFKKGRSRMILEALEEGLYNPKTEKVTIERGSLTIEHLMPVQWEKHWMIGEELDGKAAKQRIRERDEAIHRVGNLTLLTGALNPSVSNGGWQRKRQAISKNGVLKLHQTFLSEEEWDEGRIDARSAELFEIARRIWPHPASM